VDGVKRDTDRTPSDLLDGEWDRVRLARASDSNSSLTWGIIGFVAVQRDVTERRRLEDDRQPPGHGAVRAGGDDVIGFGHHR
jgi:hypothetical protein